MSPGNRALTRMVEISTVMMLERPVGEHGTSRAQQYRIKRISRYQQKERFMMANLFTGMYRHNAASMLHARGSNNRRLRGFDVKPLSLALIIAGALSACGGGGARGRPIR